MAFINSKYNKNLTLIPLGSANVHLIDHSVVGFEDARGKQRIISRLRKGTDIIRQETIPHSPQTHDILGKHFIMYRLKKLPFRGKLTEMH
jgi:hypothetical protein